MSYPLELGFFIYQRSPKFYIDSCGVEFCRVEFSNWSWDERRGRRNRWGYQVMNKWKKNVKFYIPLFFSQTTLWEEWNWHLGQLPSGWWTFATLNSIWYFFESCWVNGKVKRGIGKSEGHVDKAHFLLSIHASMVCSIHPHHPYWYQKGKKTYGCPWSSDCVCSHGIVWLGARENFQDQISVTLY